MNSLCSVSFYGLRALRYPTLTQYTAPLKPTHDEVPILEILPEREAVTRTPPPPSIADEDEFFRKKILRKDGKRQIDFSEFGAAPMHPLLRNMTFEKELLLEDDFLFPHGISFVHCVFKDEVSFKAAIFTGPAYFWNCRFHHRFSFFRTLVSDACCKVQMRDNGEVNFSYCYFNFTTRPEQFAQPSFDRATLHGTTYFHRTVFANGVSAEECRFRGGVKFDSSGGDICLHKSEIDFLPDEVQKALWSVIPRVLSTNTDHKDHLDFNGHIDSEKNLDRALVHSLAEQERREAKRRRKIRIRNTGLNRWKGRVSQAKYWLAGNGWIARLFRVSPNPHRLSPDTFAPHADFNRLRRLWRDRFHAEMFGGIRAQSKPKWLTSFRGSEFGKGSSFSHVTLSNCRFLGANLDEVTFSVVDWVKQPCGLIFRKIPGFCSDLSQRSPRTGTLLAKLRHGTVPFISWRSVLLDEVIVDRDLLDIGSDRDQLPYRRTELSELYHELRLIYDRQGDGQVARDFYFGELEASRLSKTPLIRWAGLLNLYRIFSGYSKREGLALAWVLFYILCLFPSGFYWWVNRWERKAITTPPPTASIQVSAVGVPRASAPPTLLPRVPALPAACHLSGERLGPLTAGANTGDQERFGNAMNRMLEAVDGGGSVWDRFVRVIGSSLQASTFLTTTVQNVSVDNAVQTLRAIRCQDSSQGLFYEYTADVISGREKRRRLVEAVERTLVAAQLALFLLALRSKFQRTH